MQYRQINVNKKKILTDTDSFSKKHFVVDVSDVPELSSAPTPKLSALICLSNAFKSSTLRHTGLQQKHQTHNPLLFIIRTNTDTQQTLPITAMKQTEREKSYVKGCFSILILASNFKTGHKRKVKGDK